MKRLILMVSSIFMIVGMASVSNAVEVEGVNVADSANVGGEALVLNGAGVRSKFFFDIYIGALYLSTKTQDGEQAIASQGNKRVWMHFLYNEVSKDKLISGWNEGFKKNNKKAKLAELQTSLDQFNTLFQDMVKGDTITFDFLEGGATTVAINDKQVGSIEGADFQHALLAVWLGKKPADGDLKEGMLDD